MWGFEQQQQHSSLCKFETVWGRIKPKSMHVAGSNWIVNTELRLLHRYLNKICRLGSNDVTRNDLFVTDNAVWTCETFPRFGQRATAILMSSSLEDPLQPPTDYRSAQSQHVEFRSFCTHISNHHKVILCKSEYI